MEYVSHYDMSNIMVSHKVTHTMQVAEHSARIAKSLGLCERDIFLAWMLGLLHDFGRFEQFRRYGTFRDSESADHAELGADILFYEGYIESFVQAGLPREELSLVQTAIRQHNKLMLSDVLPDRTRMFSQILRDADKIDIFRVVNELPFEQRAGKSVGSFLEKEEASPECMEYVFRHRCIPRALIRSRFEVLLSHICFAFELYYEESWRIVTEQGYLRQLLATVDESGAPVWDGKPCRQLEQCRLEIEKQWKSI